MGQGLEAKINALPVGEKGKILPDLNFTLEYM
jgi:hypothetical protein